MGLLDGKRAIVTGAGRGLGRAYAMALAAEGARVVVNDLDFAEAERVVAEIGAAGGSARANGADVGDWAAAGRLVGGCVEAFGGLEVVVNNAGYTRAAPIWAETEEGFDRLVRANLKGTFNVTRHALDYLRPQQQGSIINVSSGAQAGYVPRSIYAATKAGVAGFTYTWALELAPHNIRVNALSPTAQTRMSEVALPEGEAPPPLRRPENIAPLVVYLASDEAGWITGQVFRVTGNILSLFSHPKPIHPTEAEGAWTLAALRERLPREFRDRLVAVGLGASEYQFREGLGG
jgi:NAD(P)-dependent dehydrogenase (short-subunit alcohol dehydrogenase family)